MAVAGQQVEHVVEEPDAGFALADRAGISRYGQATVPMDEARASCAIDISGRGLCAFEADLPPGSIGNFDHELAEEFFRAVATNAQITLHLKVERGTIVTDGRRIYTNTTGNPGMATGGTGDVLTGLTAALVGQGLEPFAAAQLAVFLHGMAGDLARDALGETALIASDMLDSLPYAFMAHATDRTTP